MSLADVLMGKKQGKGPGFKPKSKKEEAQIIYQDSSFEDDDEANDKPEEFKGSSSKDLSANDSKFQHLQLS